MNRPNKKDYREVVQIINGVITTYISDNYTEDLENYCDELEDRCLSDEWNLQLLDKDCTKLEKALDKASKILEEGYGEEYASYIYMKNLDEGIEIPSHMNIIEWKEWLMKDE